jgi:hypothetical protein
MAMIDELVASVVRADGLEAEHAARVVASMLRFLAARLPSPLFGELQARLHATVDDLNAHTAPGRQRQP